MRRRLAGIVLVLATAAVACSGGDGAREEASRALWEAARDGDLEALVDALEACGDPLETFEAADGERYTAREVARARREGELGGGPIPEDVRISLELMEGALLRAEADHASLCG